MTTDDLVFHCHNWAITKETFVNSKLLSDFFHLLSTDNGLPQSLEPSLPEFVTAVEAKEYPIFGCLYHPEYQFMHFLSDSNSTEKTAISRFEQIMTAQTWSIVFGISQTLTSLA